MDGNGKPLRNVKEWTDDLRRFKETKNIRNTLERQAEAFLSGNVFV